MATHTPADLAITPRDRRFGRGQGMARWWLAGDPVATAFYNALSVTFPKGEGFFIDSVRRFRDGAEPKLAAEIAAFTRQEVLHTREHVAFNRRVTDAGYAVEALEARIEERLAFVRSRPPIVSLAATMALEHFTAILAHELLADPRHLEGADRQAAALWRWHAAEEIEHKGVAYDTWLHATLDWPRLKRWKLKARVMLLVTQNFLMDRVAGMVELLRQDGLRGPRLWAAMAWFAFVKPGMVRRIARAWTAFFLPGFHPWKQDDRHLLARSEPAEPAEPAEPVPALAA